MTHELTRNSPRAWRTLSNVRRIRTIARCLGLMAAAASCKIGSSGNAASTTGHERYARALKDAGLQETVLGRDWLTAADSVLRAPLDITLPFREDGAFSRAEARAVGYRVSVPAGRSVTAVVRVTGRPMQVFVDLFAPRADSTQAFTHRGTARVDSTNASEVPDSVAAARTYTQTVTFEAREQTTLILRLQPELLRDGRYRVEVTTAPILAFPVKGGSNRSVQSFFGADRDGGQRVHHGIDIFAPRGTPVVAGVNGVVGSLAPNELGGKVVWLFDADRALWLYHAHLDSHATSEGRRVRVGDTIGFVGNTGNAKTTPPHLHFGVYRRGGGAIDPWPWVRRDDSDAPTVVADLTLLGSNGRVSGAASAVVREARVGADTIRRLARDTPVQIRGASAGWYRVELDDGVAGYLPARAVSAARRSLVDGSHRTGR